MVVKKIHLDRSLSYRNQQDMHVLFNLPDIKKRAIAQLQGIGTAVIYDGVISDQEIKMLAEWLASQNALVHDEWPISRLISLVRDIIADGIVTQEERSEIFAFLSGIAQPCGDQSQSPTAKPPLLFDEKPAIVFPGHSFLFTGDLQFGSRDRAEQEVARRGGSCPGGAYKLWLDYLVVGDLGSEAWKYGKFGTKIEACLDAKSKKKSKTAIVRENDFVSAIIEGS